MVYFVDTLQGGAIYEMDLSITNAIGMRFQRIEGSNFGNEFRGIGESGETAQPCPNRFCRGLRM
jgi:hypothetical protein